MNDTAAPKPPEPPKPPPTLAPAPMVTSLTGLGTEAFTAEAQAILAEPFRNDEVEIRSDGIVFMPAVWYRARMIRAFGAGGWAIGPRSPARMIGDEAMYEAALIVLGRIVAVKHGGCRKAFGMTQADAFEGALSDALGKCCKELMPAVLPLWDKDWRDAWLAKYAEQDGVDKNGKPKWKKRDKPLAGKPEPPLGRMLSLYRPADTVPSVPPPTPVAADAPDAKGADTSAPSPKPAEAAVAPAAPPAATAPTGSPAAAAASAAPPASAPPSESASSPKPSTASSASTTPSPGGASSSATASASSPPSPSAPESDGIAELQAAAKALQAQIPQWTLEYLRSWMFQLWDVRKSSELTREQRLAGASLLDAARVSREAYVARLQELRLAGVVKR